MPVTGLARVTANTTKEWKPVAEDVYQVVIKDIVEKEGKKYKSDEDIVQYLFKLVILDEGEFNGQMLTVFCSTTWFGGVASKGMNPSKLVTIFKAIYGFYLPDLNVNDMEASEVDSLMQQNVLIGAQVRVNVKLTDDKSGNKVTDFMSIKKELPIPEDVKIEGNFVLTKEVHEAATTFKRDNAEESVTASTGNPSSPEDFIKGLEEDAKKEDDLNSQLA